MNNRRFRPSFSSIRETNGLVTSRKEAVAEASSTDTIGNEVKRMRNTMINQVQDEYTVLSARELASRLHIGRDKAYALIKSKSFPSIKLGGRYIVTAKALNEWLDQYEYKTFLV